MIYDYKKLVIIIKHKRIAMSGQWKTNTQTALIESIEVTKDINFGWINVQNAFGGD